MKDSRTVSFSFDTEEEKAAFVKYAHEKGMKLSALAKMAMYQYRAKYPLKTVRNEGMCHSCEKDDNASKSVQRQSVGGCGDDGSE